MPLRRCARCRGYHRTGERCPATRGPHGEWSPGRDRRAQQRLRNELLERAGGRCEYRDGDGTRCAATRDLRACHTGTAVRHGGGYDARDAQLLCRNHDRATDPYAR